MESSKSELKKKFIVLLCIFVIIICVGIIVVRMFKKEEPNKTPKEKPNVVQLDNSFNINLIRTINSEIENENYLISPYNIELALNMLREGASGNTKSEIDKVIGNRTINDVSIENKLNIANGIFIKNDYKSAVKKSFTDLLKDRYKAEILYDDYETPKVINDWVKENTNGMIDKILDEVSSDYVMGLASALALDVKWERKFECITTSKEEFTKVDNSKMDTEMMHQTYVYGAKYLKNDEIEGVILPYRKEEGSNVELEFVGIIPNDSVSNYINNLTNEKLDNIFKNIKESSNKLYIHLSLPRFTYSYSANNFTNTLKTMGINDAFNKELANFNNMIDTPVYVSTAIHKTKIDLNEEGTKAAAVTYFGVDAAGMLEPEHDDIYVKFNKPFVYMIREKNTGEILFFGSVYEPNKWNGSTCKDK